MHRKGLLNSLQVYQETYSDEKKVVEEFKDFILANSDCFNSHFELGHITASAWVLNPQMNKVLLTHHRKLNKWLQLGGHSDGETVSLNIALREAQEESGIKDFVVLSSNIFDLDVHEIPARGEFKMHKHYDVRFLLQATTEQYIISEESYDLLWVDLENLENYNDEETMLRMRRKIKGFI